MTLPVAGYASTLNIGGTSTATVAEACGVFSSALGAANKVYQITNAAKRCIDPAVALTVKDGGGAVGASNFIIDYLYGKIRFVGYTPGGAITIDCSYIPLLVVGLIKGITASFERDVIDSSQLSNGVVDGERCILGKKNASGEIEYMSTEFDDWDPGAGTQRFYDYLAGGVSFLIDVQIGLAASPAGGFRAWCKLPSIARDGISKGADLIGKKMKWKATNGADDPTKDAWFSMVELYT